MQIPIYRPKHQVRFVTAAALFDGHDASINIMRRILQASGVEVIHLGHNRSVHEVASAAIQEDVQGIAISSYQGGHLEYLTYLYDLLHQQGSGHIRIFAGGGGVIIPTEINRLQQYGIARVFSPEDGRVMGLQGMINMMIQQCDAPTPKQPEQDIAALQTCNAGAIARLITLAEQRAANAFPDELESALLDPIHTNAPPTPVVGITGTGGAGKSSLTDELVRRFLDFCPNRTIAILSIDPTKLKTGGALLGDRIRMNAIHDPRVYMRSMATRGSKSEISDALKDAIAIVKQAGFDLILVETSGIGQGNSAIVDRCDIALYVMTSEFGAASQLEKIDMIDLADIIAINKFERRGSEDALRDVRKQFKRARLQFDVPDQLLPVFGTIASQFNDPGTTALFINLMQLIGSKTGGGWHASNPLDEQPIMQRNPMIPPERIGYLGDIVRTVRQLKSHAVKQAGIARGIAHLRETIAFMQAGHDSLAAAEAEHIVYVLGALLKQQEEQFDPECQQLLASWPAVQDAYKQEQLITRVSANRTETPLTTESLSGIRIPRISLPRLTDDGDLLRWLLLENLPGYYPYTAGVFPLKRTDEDPRRQFAGEGTPERTNRRFHFLSQNDEAKRLSTAFDSVTLYGQDPDIRPDIYGKIGNSGVNVCTLDDMKKLYAGFDLCSPSVSVSMTINGPAPIILAMYMNAAIDQQSERFMSEQGRAPDAEELESIKAATLRTVRGTVQADILKEDQGQNTCIYATEFALKMMGDIQQYFITHQVRSYYSVSISGYHIAEAGANPVTQLAFTLANGFTYVEYYLSRGMAIDDFAPNLSFFFSNGLDPEYSVMGRVARRIWATVIKNRYGGNARSQKLKYHIQTSGRSLHAQEMSFNDIRTTLQALIAMNDHCNSLHTNAYDEAVTTPTEKSVRRAMAIQMIINKEFGLAKTKTRFKAHSSSKS